MGGWKAGEGQLNLLKARVSPKAEVDQPARISNQCKEDFSSKKVQWEDFGV